ncbi:NB-ARC domains-containing protein [Artemisia annua]|uniref:NB-ARC domains-containing protein n=1 Tax=Artemisia annua TaxID=35608 RepID=A0A2U1NA93_ARTAN|nr:NB-ARC domains-containing protein [Artemisia annua]
MPEDETEVAVVSQVPDSIAQKITWQIFVGSVGSALTLFIPIMAELVLSALLQVIFEKLASVALNKIARSKEIHSQLKKWERSLSQIRALLNDASQKEVTDEAVKQWLNGLQHLVYDIDDMLDALATDVTHREFTNESEGISSKVRKLIPTCCTNLSLSTRMDGELNSLTTRLQELIDEKNNLGLIVKDGGPKSKNRNYKTSLVDAPRIVGREGDKKELLQKLLGDEPCSQNFSIVPIVGMGGIGKTTLARLLYDDQQVKDRFELKAWVCVSDDFNHFNISKVIFQSIGGETKEFADLNLLQAALKNQLTGKRFLLVLDDIWSEKLEDWETLAAPFFEVAHGSKIIITTRKQHLLNKLGYDHPYDLKKLSHDDALSLFAQYALGVKNFDLHPVLRPHGEGIVKKCDGLPLALKALGSLLRTKTDEEDWKQLLNNEIWMLEDGGGIVPALRLSYHDLSARLKQLFAYCCLIPKDYVFEKDDLIFWWMAEGFLHNSATHKSMERLGEEYFQELLSRSFFQHVPHEESLFVMHDLMNDLATFVAGDFFVRLDLDVKKDVRKTDFKKYRHMSFACETYMTYNKFKAFERVNSLRTFLAMPNAMGDDSWQTSYLSSKLLADILHQLPLLRVLSLSKLEIVEVPECVGNMKHLRYLNLSRTGITHLPENVCNLYNLHTLIVSGCGNLTKLPENFLKLKNLRHFDIRDTLLWNMMPLGISVMKSLQTLSNKVVVAENNAFFVYWVRNLKNLQAGININELQRVQSVRDIWGVNFSEKRVGKLHMGWSNVFDDSRNEELEKEVLGALKPHSDNLKDLVIESYGGKVFPNWIGDPSFLRLTSVRIEKCENCMFLPPLGELPSLKKLVIQELNEVKVVGSEFLGTGIAFPKLEGLKIRNMRGWEVWSTKSGVVGAVLFPCIEELYIDNCPNLAQVSLEALPSLRVLHLSHCGDGVLRSLIRVASSVTKLRISSITGLSDGVWRGVMDNLGAAEELSIRYCHEIRYLWESEAEASKVLVNLRMLDVLGCSKLVSLGEKEDGCNQLTSLRILELWSCQNLERCNLPNNIQELCFFYCDSLASVSFPTGGHKLKSLKIDTCEQLLEKEVLLNTSMPSLLEVVHIWSWQNLKLINELTCFIHITQLTIQDCSSIESFPAADLPNLTSLTHLTIRNCKSMDVDSFGVWPSKLGSLTIGGLKKPISKFGPQNFPPSLVHLILLGGSAEDDDVTSGSQSSHMLPSSLTQLHLLGFEELETVSKGLQHLTSLQYLIIWWCPKIQDLPEELLPSLLSLEIYRCTDELKEKTSRRGFQERIFKNLSALLWVCVSFIKVSKESYKRGDLYCVMIPILAAKLVSKYVAVDANALPISTLQHARFKEADKEAATAVARTLYGGGIKKKWKRKHLVQQRLHLFRLKDRYVTLIGTLSPDIQLVNKNIIQLVNKNLIQRKRIFYVPVELNNAAELLYMLECQLLGTPTEALRVLSKTKMQRHTFLSFLTMFVFGYSVFLSKGCVVTRYGGQLRFRSVDWLLVELNNAAELLYMLECQLLGTPTEALRILSKTKMQCHTFLSFLAMFVFGYSGFLVEVAALNVSPCLSHSKYKGDRLAAYSFSVLCTRRTVERCLDQ